MVTLSSHLGGKKKFKDNRTCSNFCQRIINTAGITNTQIMFFLQHTTSNYSYRKEKS